MQWNMTWMDLETVIQSEVSQKEKNKYCILMPICGTQKNGTDEPVCREGIETQMQRTNVRTPRGESVRGVGDGGVINWEIEIDIYTLICIKWITNKNLPYKKINKIKFKKKYVRNYKVGVGRTNCDTTINNTHNKQIILKNKK